MRLLVGMASIGVVALAVGPLSLWERAGVRVSAQESKNEQPKAEVVKATYLVKGLH